MNTIWIILKVIIFTSFLTISARQLYNILFFIYRKPILYIVSMFFLNILFIVICAKIQDSNFVTLTSSLITFFAITPPKKKFDDHNLINEIYTDMGIEKGALKSKIGRIAYILGGLMGWLIAYAKVVNI
mgnify:CR=1 FL=1